MVERKGGARRSARVFGFARTVLTTVEELAVIGAEARVDDGLARFAAWPDVDWWSRTVPLPVSSVPAARSGASRRSGSSGGRHHAGRRQFSPPIFWAGVSACRSRTARARRRRRRRGRQRPGAIVPVDATPDVFAERIAALLRPSERPSKGRDPRPSDQPDADWVVGPARLPPSPRRSASRRSRPTAWTPLRFLCGPAPAAVRLRSDAEKRHTCRGPARQTSRAERAEQRRSTGTAGDLVSTICSAERSSALHWPQARPSWERSSPPCVGAARLPRCTGPSCRSPTKAWFGITRESGARVARISGRRARRRHVRPAGDRTRRARAPRPPPRPPTTSPRCARFPHAPSTAPSRRTTPPLPRDQRSAPLRHRRKTFTSRPVVSAVVLADQGPARSPAPA